MWCSGGAGLETVAVARQLATTHWFDIGAARRDLAYQPQIGLDEGFRRLAVFNTDTAPPWLCGGRHPSVRHLNAGCPRCPCPDVACARSALSAGRGPAD